MKYELEKIDTWQYKNALLCDMHGKLIHLSSDQYSGQYRKEPVFLSKAATIIGMPQYNPPVASDISSAMRDLEKFIQKSDAIDKMIKTTLAHYQFETIHPFMTGN